jgi:hypothetical protein
MNTGWWKCGMALMSAERFAFSERLYSWMCRAFLPLSFYLRAAGTAS